MAERPLVQNAADPRQVGHAGRKVRDRATQEADDLRAVLATEPGRRVLWRFLKVCGVNETVLRQNALEMAAAAGRQNVGHYLMAQIEAADDTALFTMMREATVKATKDNRETAAVQAAAEERDTDG